MLDFYSRFKEWAASFDVSKIASNPTQFLFVELVGRALNSDDGFASTTVGIPFFQRQFVVVTREEDAKAFFKFGEDPENPIPTARDAYSDIGDLIDPFAVVLRTGGDDPLVQPERAAFRHTIKSSSDNLKIIWQELNQGICDFDPTKPAFENIRYDVVRIIAQIAAAIDKGITRDLIPVLDGLEESTLHRYDMPVEQQQQIQNEFNRWQTKYNSPEWLAKIPKNPNTNFIAFLNQKRGANPSELRRLTILVANSNISSTLIGGLLNIAANPTIQRKLFKEINQLGDLDFSRPEGLNALKKCKYLESVYYEALRLYPSPNPIARLSSGVNQFGSHTVGPNARIFLPIRDIMRDPNCWGEKDVDTFRPERFIDTPRKVGKYPFIPFGGSPRSCPASTEMVRNVFYLAVTAYLKRFNLSFVSKNDKPPLMVAGIAGSNTFKDEYLKLTPREATMALETSGSVSPIVPNYKATLTDTPEGRTVKPTPPSSAQNSIKRRLTTG